MTVYTLELDKWDIKNDGTNPNETTKGINAAFKWAKKNGFKTMKIPNGTYLIAKGTGVADRDARINMLSDMTFLMSEKAVLQKEANGFEEYSIIHIGAGLENVKVQNGTLIGDRENHNYTEPGDDSSSGTHEWGHGINIVGGKNILVEGVKIQKCTGDGMYIGGSTIGGSYITEKYLETGSIDDNGNPINEAGKIRTIGRAVTNFDDAYFATYPNIHMWLPEALKTKNFKIFYYSKDDRFIASDEGRVYSNGSIIPVGADYYRAVFDADTIVGVKVNQMTIDNAKDVVIKDNDIGYNRRQGITAGGENVEILNNTIHHTNGTAPQAGIDIEPGNYPAINHLIKGNQFLDNKIQIVLAYGENIVIDGNDFEQTSAVKGGVGLHIHNAYRGSKVVQNNRFNGSGMTLYPNNMSADNNKFSKAEATLHGDNQALTNSTFDNASLSIGTGKGQKVSNLEFSQNGELGGDRGALYIWENAVHMKDVTIQANTKGKRIAGIIQGYGNDENKYENLKVVDKAERGTVLPAGSYIDSSFDVGDLAMNREGKYVLENAHIKGKAGLLTVDKIYGDAPEVIIRNSTLELTKDIGYGAAVYVLGAKDFQLLDSVVLAKNNTVAHAPVIKFGPYGYPKLTNILAVTVKGNEIHTKKGMTALDTSNAGTDAPPYLIEDNKIINGSIKLTNKDINKNNKLVRG